VPGYSFRQSDRCCGFRCPFSDERNARGNHGCHEYRSHRVKPGKEQDFTRIHEEMAMDGVTGLSNPSLVKAGERSFIVVGHCSTMEAMAAARPATIANLDRQRPILKDLGGGRGVTEPWSGEVVLQRQG
jgi:hypothetical protein